MQFSLNQVRSRAPLSASLVSRPGDPARLLRLGIVWFSRCAAASIFVAAQHVNGCSEKAKKAQMGGGRKKPKRERQMPSPVIRILGARVNRTPPVGKATARICFRNSRGALIPHEIATKNTIPV